MSDNHLDDWNTLLDMLLRGVSHSLSNRTAALSGLAELPTEDDPEIRALIPAELGRLHELNRLVRLLPAEPAAAPEALAISDLVADVVAIAALHPRWRELHWTTPSPPEAVAVRARRWMLVRVLLLASDSIAEAALGAGVSEVVMETRGGNERVTVLVRAAADALPPVPRAASALATELGAVIEPGRGSLTLRFPSLAAVRRREQAARG